MSGSASSRRATGPCAKGARCGRGGRNSVLAASWYTFQPCRPLPAVRGLLATEAGERGRLPRTGADGRRGRQEQGGPGNGVCHRHRREARRTTPMEREVASRETRVRPDPSRRVVRRQHRADARCHGHRHPARAQPATLRVAAAALAPGLPCAPSRRNGIDALMHSERLRWCRERAVRIVASADARRRCPR
jgi:hypothetical protein